MCRLHKMINQIDEPCNYGDMKWRHVACLIIGHKIVSIGSCNSRSKLGDLNMPSIHAEINALMKYLGSHNIKNINAYLSFINGKKNKTNNKNRKYQKMLLKLKNAEVIVIRKSNNLNIKHYLESRQCNECVKTLKKFGIKKVHYSNEKGEIITEKVKDMELKHITHGVLIYKNNLLK